jgi:hypothetical protein
MQIVHHVHWNVVFWILKRQATKEWTSKARWWKRETVAATSRRKVKWTTEAKGKAIGRHERFWYGCIFCFALGTQIIPERKQ